MKHTAIFSIILSIFIVLGAEGANAQETSVVSVDPQETVSVNDLGTSEPTLLPSSPFYFFKNWSRGIQKALTFNPVKKVELELRFADEKVVEAQKLAKTEPSKVEAIERAIENYRTSQLELKKRIGLLKETSKNPRVDALLEKLADRTVKHDKLFGDIKEKFEDKAGVKTKIESATKAIEDSFVESAKKDDAEKFSKKLEKALTQLKGDDLKNLSSIEFIDRIEEKIDENMKERLSFVRNKFAKHLEDDLKKLTDEQKEEAGQIIKEKLENLSGDKARRLLILQEIEKEADKSVREALKGVKETLEKNIENEGKIQERYQEAVRHAEDRIKKLEEKISGISAVPQGATNLLKEARVHLEKALKAAGEQKFGEAFGQANSAEVIARNALKILDKEKNAIMEKSDLENDISELEIKIVRFEGSIESLSNDAKNKAQEAIASVREHLNDARENLARGEVRETETHIKDAKAIRDRLEILFKGVRIEKEDKGREDENRQEDRQLDRQEDRQLDRQEDRQINRQENKQVDKQQDRQQDRREDRQLNKQEDKQAEDRQEDKQIDRRLDRQENKKNLEF